MRERLMDIINQTSIELYRSEYDELVDALLDNGVIVPPLKVGQTVYRTDGVRIYELKVNGVCDIIYDTDTIAFSKDVIGRRIFLTREAAEAALKAGGTKC